ncbi:MAG: alkaline phosphatase family protein [Candidatus Schekmanbacteria bacterium]|nr:alkaline phosphatase family protein [Candidatus Schekmanbacteria bacterium]
MIQKCNRKIPYRFTVLNLLWGILISFPQSAWAYIDPGTSGFAFSFLGPVLAALGGTLALFFRPIMNFLRRLFKQNPKTSKIVVLIIIAVSAALGYYFFLSEGRENKFMSDKKGKKIIVLGMDGLDPKIMERLMDEGALPNFNRLRLHGDYAHLQTSNPAQSPVAWSCMATGANPGQHGLFDFIRRDPQTYMPDLAILKFNRGQSGNKMFSPVQHGQTFWEIVSEAGLPSKVIRWPITFPPKEGKSQILAGMGVPDIKGTLGHYAFYTTEVVDPDDPGKYKIITVAADKNAVIKTEIVGPQVGGIFKKNASLPLLLKPNKERRELEINVDGQTIVLAEKRWSKWVQLNFSAGLLKKISAIGKFYLAEVAPELKLYLSPLQVNPLSPAFFISQPEEYAAELAEAVGLYHTLGIPEDTNALNEKRLDEDAFLESCTEIEREREKMLIYELSRFKSGLLALVFDTSDRIQHMFWRASNNKTGRYQHVISDMYKGMDQLLGVVLRHVDHDTTLLICSDHGFTSFDRAVNLNSWLVEQGYMQLSSRPSVREDNSLFADVVWESTQAYALGFGAIYLNRQGREAKGIVSVAEADRLSSGIIKKLQKLQDPLFPSPVINKVYKSGELYSGPYADQAPDLVVGFCPGYRASWQTAIGGAPVVIFEDNLKTWSGDHCVDPQFVPGILFSNRKLKGKTPRIIDIAPTVLEDLGLTVPDSMEGQPLL